MPHPGPPQFVAVGDDVELAPRDPDPEAEYAWRLVESPDGSTASLGTDPVEHLVPDESGTYVVELTAPDGTYRQTIQVFPGDRSPTGAQGASGSGASGGHSGPRGGSGPGRSGSGSGSGVDAHEGDAGGEAGGRPRLTLETTIEGDEVVVHADPQPHPDSSEQPSDLQVVFLLDDRDPIGEDDVTRDGNELRIPVANLPSRARVHAVALGADSYSVPDAVELTREDVATDGGVVETTEGDVVETYRPYDPPEWAEDSVIYEIYVRTFGETDPDESEFDAIVDRLDYIESLGVDVLWLTPVLQNDHAPHGYNITDFFEIASNLGTRDDYERFVEAAHDRGMKVLFDLVCNHSARSHPFFQDAVEDPTSEYRDWYEWRSDTEPETYFDWEYIANFNFDNLSVRRHLLDAVDEWQPLVDGFRCDMAWAVPNGFWRELHDRCKDRDREFLLLDETIPYIPDFQAGLFDMHFDSMTYWMLREIGRGTDADSLLDAIHERKDLGFPDHASFMLYAENHDETRYIVECGRPAAKAALGALFSLPGAPLLYAGQEFGQRGRRDTLAWDHADGDLQDHVRSLASARHTTPALETRASIEGVDYDVVEGDRNRVTAYTRATDDDAAVVVLNFGESPAAVSLPVEFDPTDRVSGEDVVADAGPAGTVSVDSVAVLSTPVDD